MGSYNAARTAANASHAARQRQFGGGISDAAEDRKEVAAGVHKHERHLHSGEKETKLRNGGAVEGRADGGRRMDRKGKHKGTTVNIIMGGGGGQQGNPQREQMAHQAGMQQGAQLVAAKLGGAGGPGGAPPPGMPPGGGGGPPPAMGGPGGPPHPPIAGMGPGGPPPMMPGRKRGGRALGESMKYGAGSGEGRLEKERMAKKEMRVE